MITDCCCSQVYGPSRHKEIVICKNCGRKHTFYYNGYGDIETHVDNCLVCVMAEAKDKLEQLTFVQKLKNKINE